MESDNLLLTVAIVAVVISVIGAGITYMSVNSLKEVWRVTGFAGTTGTLDVNITSLASINFTTDVINFSSGSVTQGLGSATLQTNGTVAGGSWSAVSSGFVLENIGNVNVTLKIKTGSNASKLFGGTGAIYQYNISNVEASSCNNTWLLGAFNDVNDTSPGTLVCGSFQSVDASDTIKIDVKLGIPSDSFTGDKIDTFTATIAAV